jgi:hypothetical protein
MYCATKDCRWHTEKKGGGFEMRDGELYCEDCIDARRYGDVIGTTCANLHHFTTTHFNGHPIEVRNLGHLRSLEKQYGCSNHVANNDQKNWSTPPPVRPHPETRYPWQR